MQKFAAVLLVGLGHAGAATPTLSADFREVEELFELLPTEAELSAANVEKQHDGLWNSAEARVDAAEATEYAAHAELLEDGEVEAESLKKHLRKVRRPNTVIDLINPSTLVDAPQLDGELLQTVPHVIDASVKEQLQQIFAGRASGGNTFGIARLQPSVTQNYFMRSRQDYAKDLPVVRLPVVRL